MRNGQKDHTIKDISPFLLKTPGAQLLTFFTGKIPMAALPGNQYNKKLKTPELKAEAYRQYCAHIAEGYSKENFWFEHPDLTITWETVETYIKKEPKERSERNTEFLGA